MCTEMARQQRPMQNANVIRVNRMIKVAQVRVITEDGKQLGVITTADALTLANLRNLDLVEIAPNASPPVCKLLDYGKYKFEIEKKQKETRKHQKFVRLKEVRMQPKISQHDLDFKSRKVSEFLAEGNKVKVTIRFRGRELAHTHLGEDVLNKIIDKLDTESFLLERKPTMEGRAMSMTLASKTKIQKGENNAKDENS